MSSKGCRVLSLILLLLPASGRAEEVLSSSKHAIKVHYSEPGQLAFAQKVLAAADEAWDYHVDLLKLPAPPPDAGARGGDDYDFVITTTPYLGVCKGGPAAPTTAHGLMSYIELDPSLPGVVLPLISSHEFHHAVVGGMCPVGNNIGEAGALYTSGLHRKGQGWMMSYFLGFNAFQSFPERALDWEGALGDFYPYGGALLLMFLDQLYGDGTEAGVLTRLYKRMLEGGASAPSCPTYLQLLHDLYDLDAVFKKFCRWRWFLGPNDDGRHFKDLANWEGSDPDEKLLPPTLSADHKASDLPIQDAQPKTGPMSYGASFVRIDLGGLAADARLRVGFSGEGAVRWSVQTILLGGSSPADEQEHDVGVDGQASIEISTGGRQSLVLVFANLGDGKVSKEGEGWKARSYTYSMERIDPPRIDRVDPSTLTAGTEAVLTVHGKGFPEGTPKVHLSSGQVAAKLARRVSAELVELTISAEVGAAPGAVDLELSWGAVSARRPAAFEIVEAALPPGEPTGGCALAPVGDASSLSWLALLLLGLVMARPRRR
jgi:hypothetical protein